jgi:hypothetical protein
MKTITVTPEEMSRRTVRFKDLECWESRWPVPTCA